MVGKFATIGNQIRHLAGWIPSRPDHRDFLASPQITQIPSVMDLRPSMPSVIDQGQVGDCTACMGCTLAEFLEIKYGKSLTFSRFFLYSMTRDFEGTPLSQDSGAQVRDVFKVMTQSGVCEESQWPSVDSNFSLEPSEVAKADGLGHTAVFYYNCPDLFTVKASIAQQFPVGFGFSVPENMTSDDVAKSGEVNFPNTDEKIVGGHAVVACGYNDSKQIAGDTGAVLCMNSWGISWGIDGYFWLPYRFFTNELATDMWTLRRMKI